MNQYWRYGIDNGQSVTVSFTHIAMAPISLIQTLPVFITKEQHAEYQATTPANGDFKHDPLLEHLERDVQITLEPPVDGFDAVACSQLDVYVIEAFVLASRPVPLWLKLDCVARALVLFHPSTSTGISIPYPTISLHAISRQPVLADPAVSSGHPSAEQPCVYCQLDENEGEDYDNLAEEELADTRELSLFPANPQAVQAVYAAMSRCASLHPSVDTPNGQAEALGGDDDDGADWADLMRQADGNDGREEEVSEAGRVRVDYSTPSARFGPY